MVVVVVVVVGMEDERWKFKKMKMVECKDRMVKDRCSVHAFVRLRVSVMTLLNTVIFPV